MRIQDDIAGHKNYRRGTHRVIEPSNTLDNIKPLMSHMGITRIADVTGLDRIGIPVVMVVRPNSRSVSVSQGKGLTPEGARASGLMESVESWHAERIDLPLKLGCADDLSTRHRLVTIDRLPQRSTSRYHAGCPILWIAGSNLLSGQSVWYPYELAHTNYSMPLPPGSGCFPSSSNGLASGNHPFEAMLHAICEVIERDATTVWHHLPNQVRANTRIDLGSIDDEACRNIVDRLYAADVSVAAWETTTDVGVPSFYCTIVDELHDLTHPGVGAGCHPDRGIALLRALLEAVQVRTTYISGSRDDITHHEYTQEAMREKLHTIKAQRAGNPASRSFENGPGYSSDTFAEDIDWLKTRLIKAGIDEVIVTDLNRGEFGVHITRVVIPALEAPHDEDDYQPGPRALRAMQVENDIGKKAG